MTLLATYYGEGYDNYFGVGMSCGDFNADGYEDLLIGSAGWNNTGKNYLYLGSPAIPEAPTYTKQGENYGVMYDINDKNVGDVSGDGVADFTITSTLYGAYNEISRVDLFFGGADLDTFPDWVFPYDSPGVQVGWRVDSSGDVNGDGGQDFMILQNFDDYANVFIFLGGALLDTVPDWTVASDPYGGQISGLGDVNGDGYSDILLFSAKGPIAVYFGGSPMDTLPDVVLGPGYPANRIGTACRDFNGDGYSDLALYWHFPDSSSYGYYDSDVVYFGGPDMDAVPDLFLKRWDGVTPSLSYKTMACGDFNGDGLGDIAGTGGEPGYALVRIWLGSRTPNTQPDALIYGDPYTHFGHRLAAGDIDGDGRDELLVGERDLFDPWQGQVHLFRGPATWIDYGLPAVEPEELQRHPGWFRLQQNFPNPFNASTSIRFDLGKPSAVDLAVYDLKGRKVRDLLAGKALPPGAYDVAWNGKNDAGHPAAAGVYLLVMRVDAYSQTRKLALLK